jgi:mono/diheme cytochrome c family protein
MRCVADPKKRAMAWQHAGVVAAAWLAAIVLQPAAPLIAVAEDPAALELFERSVRPLLVERCVQCHGDKKQWASLRLDSRAALLTGGDGGPAIVPGDADASELLARVIATDDSVRMPPPEAGPPLAADDVVAIRQWISLGAPWPASPVPVEDAMARKNHWAFQPVAVPHVPAVAEQQGVRNPVDSFVRHALEAAGLGHAAEADRRSLLRRVSYDLTGLPPTAEEVDAFVADDADGAYERAVERLLASPRYGEQWARHWLDVARYADTKGYVYGREERFFVHSAAYRDWVIRAFNEDLPYDRFVLLQLAADQAAVEDPAALAALGFLTVGRRFLGVGPDIIDDRIDVVGRGLLGLTVACARCHDHKYDPIPTADYYSLYGVFKNCVEQQVPLPRPPGVAPPTSEIEAELAERRRKLADFLAAQRAEAASRNRSRLAEYLLAQRHLEDYPEETFAQITDKNDLLPGIVRRWEAFLTAAERDNSPIFIPWIRLAQLDEAAFAVAAASLCRDWQQDDSGVNRRVAQILEPPPANLKEAAERYAALFVAVDSEWQALCAAARETGQPEPTAFGDAASEAIRQALHAQTFPCTIPDEPVANTEFLWDTKTLEEIWKHQSAVDRWIIDHPEAAPTAVVLADRAMLVEPQIFRRGNAAMKGAFVPRQFLGVVSGTERRPFSRGSGRLEMAEAVVSPDNPLTARVWVNRVWMHHFGTGLVATPSDFGLRAPPPSHPELLDWLAREFMAHGWSTKWLQRTIVLSATYRQSSGGPVDETARRDALERDPENRLLWRMSPHRLSFEEMRDSLLAASGELSPATGGRPVEPFVGGPDGFRRSVYTMVDRQYLPSTLNVFDFANPDLHTPRREETTVPLQALFALNSPFVAGRARAVAALANAAPEPDARVRFLYRRVLQREPTAEELAAAMRFIAEHPAPAAQSSAPDTAPGPLQPWEQLAQVLLVSNEFMFVD